MKRVYLDHNATTAMRPEVRSRWLEVSSELGGNPSSLHRSGRRARHFVDEARERIAAALGVAEEEVVFTSGGTESNNLALFGVLRAAGPGAALVTSPVEHSSVLASARALEREGHPLRLARVDASGLVHPEEVAALAEGARLVSLMAANNEVGMLLPVAEVALALRRHGPRRALVFTDAVQAFGRVELPLGEGGADLASFSAHKLGGPQGVGVLWRRRTVELAPLLFGGEQEEGLRPGTENVPALAAAAVAFELAAQERPRYAERAARLARALWEGLASVAPRARLLGPPLESPSRLPGTLDILLPGVDGKVLVTRLDLEGLEASAGSACASGSLEPSHVLLAMGLTSEQARAGLRLSIGRDTTQDDVRRAVEILRRTLGGDGAHPRGATTCERAVERMPRDG